MTDRPPPPPPPGVPPLPPAAAAPPPPPPPPSTAVSWQQVPGAATSSAGSTGLRTASIVLFWCTAAATVFVVLAVVNRRSVWVDFVEGRLDFSDVQKIDDADDLVSGAFGVTFLLGLASLIVVSIWSLRVARRARESGATNVSPGLACGSWYIPYASTIVPFVQLRRIARHRGRSTGLLNVWQAFYIVTWLAGSAVAGLEPGDDDVFDDVSDVTDMLSSQIGAAGTAMVATFVMAFVGMQALRRLDDSV